MKRIVVACDSFKGSFSSLEASRIIAGVIKNKNPDCEIIVLPIADGGEGTVDAYFYALGSEKINVKVKSPLFGDVTAQYAMLKDKTAVLEMAQASGLTLEKKNDPLLASTFGTGQMILHALNHGAKKILLGLGGSATTDGGAGCVEALGALLTDKENKPIPHGGSGLLQLEKIDLSTMDSRLQTVPITALCDVDNPLYGENGAAYVFSPQKGATQKQARLLDSGLRRLADVAKKTLKKDYAFLKGAGAAGGMGFCVTAMLGGELKSGIDSILDAADFEVIAKNADLIITGEGKLDSQSLMGKAIGGIVRRSKGTPVAAIVGTNSLTAEQTKLFGLYDVIETNPEHLLFEQIKPNAKNMLVQAVQVLAQKFK